MRAEPVQDGGGLYVIGVTKISHQLMACRVQLVVPMQIMHGGTHVPDRNRNDGSFEIILVIYYK